MEPQRRINNTYATIISLLPYDLVENKPGLFPSEYIIKKAVGDKFGLTIIPNDVHHLINADPLAEDKQARNIKVPVPAIELAKSIISDYIVALLAVSPPTAVPGLLAVSGNYSDTKEVAFEFMRELTELRASQANWFRNLVNIADDTWAKTRSPLGISDIQRSAAEALKLKRDWLAPISPELITTCPVCKNPINPGALKCATCQYVLDKIGYEKVLATS